ncbi:hypothetical protein M430DRAFT_36555 [Amorphotheca resinae ATCC 22711]|uniref:Uncharacterized protein n=1 Tax=Amorphotheca resinae ATCC 22711 TaxID=857342 RepID=A0A2T3AUU1_AMORE|nr:hypothetical protein M430DRAFT_36555 [Amorphotheca resinae ATCC 22711]PSS12424.1 hypothetical protein M430DRAFT_36555 [Amorphotheca resinae ATCC 22711]
MCDYTEVEFRCGHRRFVVREWCEKWKRTHRCRFAYYRDVVGITFILERRCGDCNRGTKRFVSMSHVGKS